MSVNLEIKGLLAKLLATEDIIIEHKKVDTACFNVETRTLTLPIWEAATDTIYTMLCQHEVSHAIWSPNIDWTEKTDVPGTYINIVEDVRVEKLCKKRYPGSPKSFYAGYKELHEQDFFCIKDDDVSTYNLADRVNLYFKIGNFIPLEFTAKEQEVVDLIASVETFDDTIHAAEVLYEATKQEFNNEPQSGKETQDSSQEESQQNSQESQSSSSMTMDSNEPQSESNNSQQQPEQQPVKSTETPSSNTSASSLVQKEPEVRTMNNLEKNIRSLNNPYAYENRYVEIPELNLETVINSNKVVHQEIDSCFNRQLEQHSPEIFTLADSLYQKFKISAQNEVNYLVKEFECRKAADSHSRSLTSNTGELDMNRLHSYLFSEDLFKKITTVSEGKNHGLIFILDWSGSMQYIMKDTVKQLYNLIWFCRKLSIPFDVYAFTNEFTRRAYDYQQCRYMPEVTPAHYEPKDGLLTVDPSFSLMHFFTSRVSSSNIEKQMKNIWRIASYWSARYSYDIPPRLTLSGTPLNESLIALHQIIPAFQRINKVQKVHTIVLTDGESGPLPFHVNSKKHNSDENYLGKNSIRIPSGFLRDRKLGTTYKIYKEPGCPHHEFTDTLLRNLKDKFPSVSFIGIRLFAGNSVRYFVEQYHDTADKKLPKILEDWRKNKSCAITKSGYHSYFLLSASSLARESQFNVSDTATKSQIKNAFTKSLNTKRTNKKILNEFISLIA